MKEREHDLRTEREVVDERLLQVLLIERHGGRGELPHDLEQELLVPPRRRARRAFWLAAAALLLGVGVVMAIARVKRMSVPPHHALQDPKVPEIVEPQTTDEFLGLLRGAKRLQVVGADIVGAHRQELENGSVDMLDSVPWLERATYEGEQLQAWCAAIRTSCAIPMTELQGSVGPSYVLALSLQDGRELRCTFHSIGDDSQLCVNDDIVVASSVALTALLTEAVVAIAEQRRRSLGLVDDVQHFVQVTGSTRLQLTSALLPHLPEVPFSTSVSRLRVDGSLGAEAWRAVARLRALQSLQVSRAALAAADLDALIGASETALNGLTELSLRTCSGLNAASLQRLTGLRRLRVLHVGGLSCATEDTMFDGLASMPALREFGVRFVAASLSREALVPLQRTKLERLLLVDVPVDVDLRPLALVPSLRALVLLGPVDDAMLETLMDLRSLRNLTLRNCRVTAQGIAELRAALPNCTMDWQPDARWFDSDYAFDYTPPRDTAPR